MISFFKDLWGLGKLEESVSSNGILPNLARMNVAAWW